MKYILYFLTFVFSELKSDAWISLSKIYWNKHTIKFLYSADVLGYHEWQESCLSAKYNDVKKKEK